MVEAGAGGKAAASRFLGTLPEKQGATTPRTQQPSKQRQPCFQVQTLIYVQYVDHVTYNRSSALAMKPQIREAVGWLIYECEDYVTLAWDRDAEPPTLRGGDPKASGLVLLKSGILEMKKIA
jgi:hypothetical protein